MCILSCNKKLNYILINKKNNKIVISKYFSGLSYYKRRYEYNLRVVNIVMEYLVKVKYYKEFAGKNIILIKN